MTTPGLISRKKESIWYDDISVLTDQDFFVSFFPNRFQNDIERLNSLMRFSIYVSILLSLYHRNSKYLLLAVLGGIITYFVYETRGKKQSVKKGVYSITSGEEVPRENEGENSSSLNTSEDGSSSSLNTTPTLNNPFMNLSVFDLVENPEKPPASFYADNTKSSVKTHQTIEEKFNHNLYKDIDQVYDKMNSQRQFYTMPSTTNPDNRETFQKWLYGDMPSYKENGYNAKIHEDLRSNIPPYDYNKQF